MFVQIIHNAEIYGAVAARLKGVFAKRTALVFSSEEGLVALPFHLSKKNRSGVWGAAR